MNSQLFSCWNANSTLTHIHSHRRREPCVAFVINFTKSQEIIQSNLNCEIKNNRYGYGLNSSHSPDNPEALTFWNLSVDCGETVLQKGIIWSELFTSLSFDSVMGIEVFFSIYGSNSQAFHEILNSGCGLIHKCISTYMLQFECECGASFPFI